MPDRHRDPASGLSVADHCAAVHHNLRTILVRETRDAYVRLLREVLTTYGLDPPSLFVLLSPVALLHDVGKTREEREVRAPHPLTGKPVARRHPVVSVAAALEILPADVPSRDTILALIDEHATPYAWFVTQQTAGTMPRHTAWGRLDQRIDPRADGTGIVLLCLLKMADIDGHDAVDEVPWFVSQANSHSLREHGRWLPVPEATWLRGLDPLAVADR